MDMLWSGFSRHRPLLYGLLAVVLMMVAGGQPSQAVILYDTGNALANTEAPVGIMSDSGWAYQGLYGDFLGTMIGSQYFITAQHIGVSASPTFTGVTDNSLYTIDAAANGGVGYWDIAGTDLRIFKINETFTSYAELYTGTAEVGMEMVVFGRGGPRGAEVMLESELKGWLHTGADGVVRWGENDVSGITIHATAGELLMASFDPISGQNESTLSVGDSGGAVFVNDGGVWKLAGINYGVDGFFDVNDDVDANEFSAALFDRGGYYQGSDDQGWSGAPLPPDSPGNMYASRISVSALEIQNIVSVPEPGSLLLVLLSGGCALGRRRYKSEVKALAHD